MDRLMDRLAVGPAYASDWLAHGRGDGSGWVTQVVSPRARG